jgi:DNA mismatch endonuclease (patch repair protein)
MGYRFRLHRRDLPGQPDIVLPRYKLAIFVHGCYWHRHPECKYAYTPKSRVKFWSEKFTETVKRDRRNQEELKRIGWSISIIWECETNNDEHLERKLKNIFQTFPKCL